MRASVICSLHLRTSICYSWQKHTHTHTNCKVPVEFEYEQWIFFVSKILYCDHKAAFANEIYIKVDRIRLAKSGKSNSHNRIASYFQRESILPFARHEHCLDKRSGIKNVSSLL